MPTPLSFAQDEWTHRQTFVRTIEKVCAEEGIAISWLSDYWIGRMEKQGQVRLICAYHFPLNSESSATTAKDKVAAYEVLHAANVPVVLHRLVRFTSDRSIDEVAHEALKDAPLPLVLKPCNLGSGRDVHKVATRDELVTTLTHMAVHYQTIASSPFEDIIDEYRVVLLDGHRLVLFRKQPEAGEWRHNLQFGGAPAEVEDAALAAKLEALALKATQALSLRFAAVDIITTPQEAKVLEVNSAFSLNRIAHHAAFSAQYEEVYRQALWACFA